MAKLTLLCSLVAVSALVGPIVHAFQPTARVGGTASKPSSSFTSLGMAPRFDKATQKWFPTDAETEGPSAGYGPVGSLYRAGPVPFFQRIFNPDTYEQAVLKYMAQDGCDRIEAQGNMDAFLENPNDWAYQKMTEKEGGPKRDYANANMDPQQIVLSTVWACVVVAFAYDAITGIIEGRYGRTDNDILHGNLWSLPF